jgi:hypothetical protein
MVDLFDLTYLTASELGHTREGTATGGSATTLVDILGLSDFDDDDFNRGALWILEDAAGEGAAPEGSYRIVTDFVASSKTLTVQTFGAPNPVGAGDKYAVSTERFPLWLIIQQINRALARLGKMPRVDKSLTSLVNTVTYTLPLAVALDLRQVHYYDDNILKWVSVLGWRIEYADIGTSPSLIFPYVIPEGKTIRLTYAAVHPELRDEGDDLDPAVHPDLVVYEAAQRCLSWYIARTGLDDLKSLQKDLKDKADQARIENLMPPLPGRDREVLIFSESKWRS